MGTDSSTTIVAPYAEQTTLREEHIQKIFGEDSERVTYHSTIEHTPTPTPQQRVTSHSNLEMTAAISLMLYTIWIAKLIYHRRQGDYTKERWIYGDNQMREYERLSVAVSDVALSLSLMLGLLLMLLQIGVGWVAKASIHEPDIVVSPILLHLLQITQAASFGRWISGITIYIISTTLLIALIYYAYSQLSKKCNWPRRIIQLKAQMIYPTMLFFMPFVVLLSLDSDNTTLGYIVLIEAVIISAIYMIRSFLLFVLQKISILQWFLYLCTVEILPISLVWIFFERSASVNF